MLSSRRTGALAVAGVATLGLVGCAPSAAESPRLVVYAAASLSGVFDELARAYEQTADVQVVLNFAGSSDLLAQLKAGAHADVLATADERTMNEAADAGLVAGPPSVFARNSLAVAVAPGNPGAVASLDDLGGDALLVICAPQVPCGDAARTLAERAGLTLHPVSEESSVSDVLAKVGTGEADAGIVYRTDLRRAAPGVTSIPIPDDLNVSTSYPIATLSVGDERIADGFREFLLGATAQELLADAGFEVAG